ncbi:MAG: OmpA family protein [Alphaproteobacteria bacterium]|nr:OmpA family protein [Alphaproteobacteria bacterium]
MRIGRLIMFSMVALVVGDAGAAEVKECPAPLPKNGIDFSLPCFISRVPPDLIPAGDEKVYFESGSWVLSAGARAVLDQQAEILRRYPTHPVETIGFADNLEAPDSIEKEKLGQKRAAEVRAYLIESGVSAARIAALGRPWPSFIPRQETEESLAAMRHAVTRISEP